jgi:hypothetical protein
MKKFLLVLIGLPLLTYLSFKIYIHYKIGDFLDTLTESASSAVKLDYGWVSSSIGGSAGVSDVRLQIKRTGDEILIDSIEVDAGSLEDLMKLSIKRPTRRRNAEVPKQVFIKLRGLKVDFDSEYYKLLEAKIDENFPVPGAPVVECGDINPYDIRHFRNLGYDSAEIDLEFGYKQLDNSTVVAIINVVIDDMQSYLSTFKYDYSDLLSNPLMAFRYDDHPKVLSADVRLTDLSYNKRLLDYCSLHSKKSRQVILDQMVESLEFEVMHILQIDSDFDLGRAERAHLKEYLLNSRPLNIKINPHDPIDFKYLKFYKPEDIPFILNLKLESL